MIHFGYFVLRHDGQLFPAGDDWGPTADIRPEEEIGPNVCLFASSGWRQPDPCCYESHKNLRVPKSRTPESCRLAPRCSPEIAHVNLLSGLDSESQSDGFGDGD
jgi:hypothetical protein